MPRIPITLRDLARSLGLSSTTVSDAINGRGRVSAETVDRVRAAAAKLGYNPNPLTGVVMSALRRARVDSVHGAIAAVDLHEPGREPHGPFHREIIVGMENRARELGFAVECFRVGSPTMSFRRLNSVIASRGIRGIAVLPSWYPPDLAGLSWDRVAGVYTDYLIKRPALNTVCADHYHLMMTVLAVLHERGYRRPGYMVPQGRDIRIEHRQTAAFRAFLATAAGTQAVPPLITADHPRFEQDFKPWFLQHRPDVVLAHTTDVIDWMRSCGAEVPAAHGFVMLNRIEAHRPCASMDLQGRLIGAKAAEMLVGQIVRGEFGFPEWPTRTAVEPSWVEGPTVRPG